MRQFDSTFAVVALVSLSHFVGCAEEQDYGPTAPPRPPIAQGNAPADSSPPVQVKNDNAPATDESPAPASAAAKASQDEQKDEKKGEQAKGDEKKGGGLSRLQMANVKQKSKPSTELGKLRTAGSRSVRKPRRNDDDDTKPQAFYDDTEPTPAMLRMVDLSRLTAFSRDGQFMAAVDAEGVARTIETATGEVQQEFHNIDGAITVAAINADGTVAVFGTADGRVHFRQVVHTEGFDIYAKHAVTQREARRAPIAAHRTAVTSLEFLGHRDMLASGSESGEIRLWHVQLDSEPQRLKPTGPVTVVSTGSRVVAAVTAEGGCALTHTGKADRPLRLITESKSIRTAAVSPSGETVAVGHTNGQVDLFHSESGQRAGTLGRQDGEIVEVLWTNDGRYVWSLSQNGSLRRFDAQQTDVAADDSDADAPPGFTFTMEGAKSVAILLTSAQAETADLVVVRDNGSAVIQSADGSVRQLDTGRLKVSTVRARADGGAFALAGSIGPVGQVEPATEDADKPDPESETTDREPTGDEREYAVQIWSAANSSQPAQIDADSEISGLAWSPDSGNVVMALQDGMVRIVSPQDGATVEVVDFDGQVAAISVAADGRRIALADDTGSIVISPLRSVGLLNGHTASVSRLRSSSDGVLLMSGGFDNAVRLWTLDRMTELKSVTSISRNVISDVAFAGAGDMMAAVSLDSFIYVWTGAPPAEPDLMSKQVHDEISELPTFLARQRSPVLVARLHDDGQTLVTADMKGDAFLWNLPTGEQIRSIKVHRKSVLSLGFATAEASLLSCGDNTVRRWTRVFGTEQTEARLVSARTGTIKGVSFFELPGRSVVDDDDEDGDGGAAARRARARRLRNANLQIQELIGVIEPDDAAVAKLVEELRTADDMTTRNRLRDRIASLVGSSDDEVDTSARTRKPIQNLETQIENASSDSERLALRRKLRDLKLAAQNQETLPVQLASFATDFNFVTTEQRAVRMAFSADGNVLTAGMSQDRRRAASSEGSGSIRAFDIATGHTMRLWREELGEIDGMHVSRNQNLFLPMPARLSFYEHDTGRTAEGLRSAIDESAVVDEDGDVLDVPGRGWLASSAESPDGELLAVGMRTEQKADGPVLKILDSTTFETIASIDGYETIVPAVAFSPDSLRLYAVIRKRLSHQLVEFSCSDLKQVRVLEDVIHDRPWYSQKGAFTNAGINAILVSANERKLITHARLSQSKYELTVWQNKGGRWPEDESGSKTHSRPFVDRQGNSPGMVFVGGKDSTVALRTLDRIQIVELKRGRLEHEIEIEEVDRRRPISRFSPDGRWVLIGDAHGRVMAWNLENPDREPRRFDANTGPISGMTFSADGKRLATAGEENRVHAWYIADWLVENR